MNHPGGLARVVVLGVTSAVAAAGATLNAIPDPECCIWPRTWSGVALWISVFTLIAGFLWVVFGPFMKERLRKFLIDVETMLLLQDLIVRIMKAPDVQLVIKSIVQVQFAEKIAERAKETAEIWVKLDEHDEVAYMTETHEKMLAEFREIPRLLGRLEQQGVEIQRQMKETRDNTDTRANELRREIAEAKLGRAHPRS